MRNRETMPGDPQSHISCLIAYISFLIFLNYFLDLKQPDYPFSHLIQYQP